MHDGPTIADRLGRADLEALAVHPEDAADLAAQVGRLSDDDLERVAVAADRLVARLGDFGHPDAPIFAGCEDQPGRPMGLLPLLALVATADDVRGYHASRGISSQDSAGGLRDLGQQLRVHRRTYGGFGLHTHYWLTCAWSGALFWLGRLQVNILRLPAPHSWDGEEHWVWGTHIPETGPLTPAAVHASFAAAREFFPRHFPDLTAEAFHCSSWLLDPQLAQMLPAESNLVRFQRRWTLYGEGTDGPAGDEEAIFFTFRQRNAELASLPRDTTLQCALLDRIEAGGHWQVRQGTIPV